MYKNKRVFCSGIEITMNFAGPWNIRVGPKRGIMLDLEDFSPKHSTSYPRICNHCCCK